MDSRFAITRDDLYTVQMDVKQLQAVQISHAERLARLEKRQADEASIKSVWNSPFPSALSGTPQHGPIEMPPPDEIFDDFEEQGQSLLGSLHLDTEDEPTRRGAASRANSVRFDESALQGSSWAQNGRQSGDFGPVRPGSGMGSHGMERTFSHKSDGRHSSAGHSVHSVHSHHSVASGRASSLGLDATFTTNGREDESPVGMPEPPASLFVLGSVPSIIRCWLTPNFAHDTLLHAVVCTGSQRSTIEYSLLRDLDLAEDIHRDLDGVQRIRLPVYLTEATSNAHSTSRGMSPAPQMPSIAVSFEVAGIEMPDSPDVRRSIRVFVGSEALREHSADILFSRNVMTLYSSDRGKLTVPFVRPDDYASFKTIRTLAVSQERPKLNATARPFVFSEPKQVDVTDTTTDGEQEDDFDVRDTRQPLTPPADGHIAQTQGVASTMLENGAGEDSAERNHLVPERDVQEREKSPDGSSGDGSRREVGSGGIWSSWRQSSNPSKMTSKDGAPLSGYQPAGRGRSMKILKPLKASNSTSARTGSSLEGSAAPAAPRTSGEQSRKSQVGTEVAAVSSNGGIIRPEAKRVVSTVAFDTKPAVSAPASTRESRASSAAARTSANPVGGASAFSWMTPGSSKRRTSAATAESIGR
ncbi:uncharacterized protein B0I36DRAFT_237911 [Microdochium trichocladiopsis]|uniref:Ubiquitin carboxyl-terminal hydrolase 19 n=1 Tax=Microdochium trichocladiopsis TaxID=1682393 RepID=A0A9P8YCD7_9PEZI|nr:uncharacterized protein B0I36DRAFT_237911 [Microdochium trichocladiopsis]KAH7038161.1 hypothetical protein B0I36DRAFT_237911 [Microdochium trichocladiopsis]